MGRVMLRCLVLAAVGGGLLVYALLLGWLGCRGLEFVLAPLTGLVVCGG